MAAAGSETGTLHTESRYPETAVVDLGGGVTMEFVLIKPGTFSMGTDTHEPDEAPVHRVTLTRPFYLGRYEVTQAQWKRIMGENPSNFAGPDRPVENVSWEDCQQFLGKLETLVGRAFALPTEAQWEYACRAGSKTEYCFGNDEAVLGEYGWFAMNSGLTTQAVGRRKPNAWGLHDMHGNVYEWCADWYSEGPYEQGDAVDPVGPATGRRRTLRGGGWIFVADNLRSADRGFSPPEFRSPEYGLRCVMEIDPRRVRVDSSLAAVVAPKPAPAELWAARLEAALAAGDRLGVEFMAAELEKVSPGDARLAAARTRAGVLPIPPETLTVDLGSGVSMEFVLIRPGTFMMGLPGDEDTPERPAHRVTITRPFYIGRYEVTQRQWSALMSGNRSAFRSGSHDDARSGDLPIDNVNWPLCQAFLVRMNEKAPGYDFRLPTEAEWEYACRAGSEGARFSDEGALGDYAWHGVNSERTTHPVGLKKANPWGLHDVYGNVWEWCQDRYAPYSAQRATDPVGPAFAAQGNVRVVRGGAWNSQPKHVNSAFRHDVGADILMAYYGFRCVASVSTARPSSGR